MAGNKGFEQAFAEQGIESAQKVAPQLTLELLRDMLQGPEKALRMEETRADISAKKALAALRGRTPSLKSAGGDQATLIRRVQWIERALADPMTEAVDPDLHRQLTEELPLLKKQVNLPQPKAAPQKDQIKYSQTATNQKTGEKMGLNSKTGKWEKIK